MGWEVNMLREEISMLKAQISRTERSIRILEDCLSVIIQREPDNYQKIQGLKMAIGIIKGGEDV